MGRRTGWTEISLVEFRWCPQRETRISRGRHEEARVYDPNAGFGRQGQTTISYSRLKNEGGEPFVETPDIIGQRKVVGVF